jgi:hypothetical protein
MWNSRITASNRRWTRRCVCGEAGILPIELATNASCRIWCAIAIRRVLGGMRRSSRRCVLYPRSPWRAFRELRVSVSRFSTIVVQGNTYSVPSRLVGTTLLMRVRAEHLEGYLGSKQVVTLPRLHGRGQHAINYHHLIWSLVRKPGAFAAYRYRDDLYPSLAFRRAYDRLTCAPSARADREYVRVLHLAATLSEAEVETALLLLEEADTVPTADAVRDLVRPIAAQRVAVVPVNLQPYDQLLPSQRCAHA